MASDKQEKNIIHEDEDDDDEDDDDYKPEYDNSESGRLLLES